MRFRVVSRLWILAVLAIVLVLPGCGKKRPPALATPGATPPPATQTEEGAPTETVEEGPDVRAIEGEGAEGSDIAGDELSASGEGGPLADIRFEYDSASLTDAARATLEKHALWLQGRRDVRVTIEGHCDERGTVEYNLALGEQRARAARDYLVSLGVSPERLRVVSFGKERPLDPVPSEAAYAKNRRARFAVAR